MLLRWALHGYNQAKGLDVNVKNQIGATPIFNAALAGNLPVVKLLVSKGADINAKNRSGLTPLHLACQNGNKMVVEFLIDNGSDINSKTERRFPDIAGQIPTLGGDRMPLFNAIMSNHKDIAELLISKGADVTPEMLNMAKGRGQTEIIELLKQHRAIE